MKIEQLPLFFSTSGALTKSNSSLQQQVIDRIDLGISNIDIYYTLVGNTDSNTPLEVPHDFYTYAITYAANFCRQSSLCTIKFNKDVVAFYVGVVVYESMDLRSDVEFNR